LKNYEIENLKDLIEDKINFYYILIKFIFKNVAYIYSIPFLKKNFMNIISFRDFYILNPNYNIYNKMQYLFELYSGYNMNTQQDSNYIKIKSSSNIENAFIREENSFDDRSFSNISGIDTEKNDVINNDKNFFHLGTLHNYEKFSNNDKNFFNGNQFNNNKNNDYNEDENYNDEHDPFKLNFNSFSNENLFDKEEERQMSVHENDFIRLVPII
jgi:hypothetical protein